MNRRKFLGLFGAGAVAAPVAAKSASEPKPCNTCDEVLREKEAIVELHKIKESHPTVFDQKAFDEILREEFKSLSADGKTVQAWQFLPFQN